MFDDWELVEASFATQYGIRLDREYDMSWTEYASLLSGLLTETPLGQIVSIRAENDKDRLKNFNRDQHAIRNAWRSKISSKIVNRMSESDKKKATKEIQDMFRGAFSKS